MCDGLTSSTPDSAMRVLTCSRSTTGPNPSTEIVSVRSPDHDAESLQLLQNSVPAVPLDGPQLTATASDEPLPHVGRQQSGHAAPWLIGGRSPSCRLRSFQIGTHDRVGCCRDRATPAGSAPAQ